MNVWIHFSDCKSQFLAELRLLKSSSVEIEPSPSTIAWIWNQLAINDRYNRLVDLRLPCIALSGRPSRSQTRVLYLCDGNSRLIRRQWLANNCSLIFFELKTGKSEIIGQPKSQLVLNIFKIWRHFRLENGLYPIKGKPFQKSYFG